MEKDKKYLDYLRFQKDRNWRNYLQCKSLLEKCLSDLSTKNEDELSKKDLLCLISSCCDYMRSLNLYNYYRQAIIEYKTDIYDKGVIEDERR